MKLIDEYHSYTSYFKEFIVLLSHVVESFPTQGTQAY